MALADCGMIDMTDHFLTRLKYSIDGRWTWVMNQDGW